MSEVNGNVRDDEDFDDDAGNRITAATAVSVLDYLAKAIVDEPESVSIDVDEKGRGRVELNLAVAPDDMGKVIGRRGRVIQSIRAVVRAAGERDGVKVDVEVLD